MTFIVLLFVSPFWEEFQKPSWKFMITGLKD